MGLQGLLRSAKERRSRTAVLRSLGELLTHRGRFATGTEELLPVLQDAQSAVPLALVAAGLLANPGLWSSFSSGAVDAYAATPRAVEFVRRSTA